jgi:hypothetical protein
MNKRVIVTTVPFGASDVTPLELLAAADIEVVFNPTGRRLATTEVREIVAGFPVIIAGTETINAEAMAACRELKAICMEIEATRESIRFLKGEPLQSPVPEEEYASAQRYAHN